MKKIRFNLIFFVLSFIFSIFFSFAVCSLTTREAKAETTVAFNSETYKTAGASVRLFENNGDDLEDGLSGIRFHVLMDVDLYNAHKDNENFKTYTAILPKRLLSGDLTVSTPNVMVLETTDVWRTYKYDTDYMESVAFIYGLPTTQYATDLVFRGLVSLDGGTTIAQQTETATRSMAYVAKASRDDKTAVLPDATKENKRITTLNAYIPKYKLVYQIGSNTTTEETEYGSVANVPNGISIWKDENNESFNPSATLTYNTSAGAVKTITLTAYAKVNVSLTNATANLDGTPLNNGSFLEVKCGTYTLNSSPITNYAISAVSIDGSNKGNGASHTLSILKDTTVSINASIITYNVTLDNVGGASITGSVNGTYEINKTCSFTLGQGFYDVTVNGTSISPNTSRTYTFTVTANSTVKIVKLSDAETTKKIMNIIASTPGTNLSVSGNNLVSPSNTGVITIPQSVFDELKKYGYSTLTFDIYKPQKKELLYRKRIQNVTNGTTIAEVGINKDSISASNVNLTSAATLEAQYKSFGTWSNESVGVNWTISNLRLS